MNINQISSASQNSTSSLSSATGGGQADSNMFMTLLVAQLKNQDPLEPQDGTAFVAQLAQFNSLDQLIGIRNAMDQLVASIRQAPVPPSQIPVPTTTPNQGEI